MKYFVEESLSDFKFWGYAKDFAESLTNEQLDTIEYILEDCYLDGISDTEINDFFAFDKETILEWLGLDDEGNEIGSKEWAYKCVSDCYDETIITQYWDDFISFEYYCLEKTTDKDDLISDFEEFICEKNRDVLIDILSSNGESVEFNEKGLFKIKDFEYDDDIRDKASEFISENIIIDEKTMKNGKEFFEKLISDFKEYISES